VPPQTRRQGWYWVLYALLGWVVGQLVALIFFDVVGSILGKTSAQLQSIASADTPPEWYVLTTLIGLWVGFVGAPWLASRTQGTGHFVRDLGLRFRWVDLWGIAIGVGGQLVVGLLYAPFQHDIHDYNAPSQRLTGGAHGAGIVVIVLATVVLVPFAEELLFRGLLFKGLVRLFTPLTGGPGSRRAAGVVLAVILDGLLFGAAHAEWVQFAGLALIGMVLATVSYRTGRLGMNMVAHGSFNAVAIIGLYATGGWALH
jgi:membrane protease YdiL (CAAX protease family)